MNKTALFLSIIAVLAMHTPASATPGAIYGMNSTSRNFSGLTSNTRNIYGFQRGKSRINAVELYGVKSRAVDRFATGKAWPVSPSRIVGARSLTKNPFRSSYNPFGTRTKRTSTTTGAISSQDWNAQIGAVPPLPGATRDSNSESGFEEF